MCSGMGMTPQSSISVMLTSARTSAIPHDSLLLASLKVATTFRRQTLAKSFSPNTSRSSALCREQLSTERASTETLRSAKSPSCPSSSLHTSDERRNSLMLPRSQSLNASCNLPTPSGRTRSPRAHRGQRNCWHLGQRNELRFMKCSRTIGVPQRLHGSPSRP